MVESSISISKCANGWLVQLHPDYNSPFPVALTGDKLVRHQARIMKEEMLKDPTLQNLTDPTPDNLLEELEENYQSEINENRTSYVFVTYKEVLAFLDFKMNQK